MKKKTLALVLAVALVVGCSIGATLAWLTDKTDTVKNTFTPSNIDIELTETFNKDANGDDTNDTWEGKMIPGYTLDKNPVVTVKAGSEDCYLFVKVEKSTNLNQYIVYNLAMEDRGQTTWTKLTDVDGVDNVWYTKVPSSTVDISYHLLLKGSYIDGMGTKDDIKDDIRVTWEQDQVAVKPSVTKDMMDALTAETYPTLSFTAYASQLYMSNSDVFTPAQAWKNAPKS